jgi:hypothetical protein
MSNEIKQRFDVEISNVVLFNTKVFQKMTAPIKIKIAIFQTFVLIHHWLHISIERPSIV